MDETDEVSILMRAAVQEQGSKYCVGNKWL
jgi:hypothetical protein